MMIVPLRRMMTMSAILLTVFPNQPFNRVNPPKKCFIRTKRLPRILKTCIFKAFIAMTFFQIIFTKKCSNICLKIIEVPTIMKTRVSKNKRKKWLSPQCGARWLHRFMRTRGLSRLRSISRFKAIWHDLFYLFHIWRQKLEKTSHLALRVIKSTLRLDNNPFKTKKSRNKPSQTKCKALSDPNLIRWRH